MLGDTLVEIRTQKGMSQKSFAKLCDITPTALNYYEKNKRNPSYDVLKKMALTLDVTIDELLSDCTPRQVNRHDIPTLEQLEEETRGYTTDELEGYFTNKLARLFKILGVSSNADKTILLSYHAAPKEVQETILEILAPYSDRTAENMYKSVVAQRRIALESNRITAWQWRKWRIAVYIKYQTFLDGKMKMDEFRAWLQETDDTQKKDNG